MTTVDYIGFDIHKKTISFCAKAQDGTILLVVRQATRMKKRIAGLLMETGIPYSKNGCTAKRTSASC